MLCRPVNGCNAAWRTVCPKSKRNLLTIRGMPLSGTTTRGNLSRSPAIFGGSWTMIARALVEEVRRMLLAGRVSQRKIAQTLGVSRGTVNAIARGRRRDNFARRRQYEEADGFTPPTGMPARCPGCGGLTQMPCLVCYIRARNDARETAGPGLFRRPNRGTSAAASCG